MLRDLVAKTGKPPFQEPPGYTILALLNSPASPFSLFANHPVITVHRKYGSSEAAHVANKKHAIGWMKSIQDGEIFDLGFMDDMLALGQPDAMTNSLERVILLNFRYLFGPWATVHAYANHMLGADLFVRVSHAAGAGMIKCGPILQHDHGGVASYGDTSVIIGPHFRVGSIIRCPGH